MSRLRNHNFLHGAISRVNDCIGCSRKATVLSCLETVKTYLNALLTVSEQQTKRQEYLIIQLDRIVEILKEKNIRVKVVNVKLIGFLKDLQQSKELLHGN